MEPVSNLAQILQTFGGWGVSAVLLFGIFYLYKTTNQTLEKRYEHIAEVLKETSAMLQQNVDELKRVESLLQRVERELERREERKT